MGGRAGRVSRAGRAAVGDPVLNYYGASYATLFGAVYANLFPATTGRMVLDGNLNPVAWSTAGSQAPVFTRLDSSQASGKTMAAFLRLCGQAATTACAFSAGTPAAAAQDRYTGPWNRRPASPILVIGNTGDPLTAYQDSVAMSRLLARARLLTVDGYGHTTSNNPSTCAIGDAVSYTVSGVLPAPGTVCQQGIKPFPAP